MKLENSNRKIHLDFHTPHWVKEVGQDYDPEKLVRIWKDAHVNAVTVVFGLCACGNAYYESDVAPVHPGLKKDMLKPLLPIAKREGIEIYVHFGPGISDRTVVEHPEWAVLLRDGRSLIADIGWGWVCFNSPWVEQKFLPQLEDFALRFPDVQGVFLDTVMYPQDGCFCNFCRTKALELGLDIDTPGGLASLWRTSVDDFLRKSRSAIKQHAPNMGFTCNGLVFISGPRPGVQDWIELEAPVSWSSYYYAIMSRYFRNLPMISNAQTTRFQRSWGNFGTLSNEAQMQFESAYVLATLGANGIGDHLPANGVPEAGVYELIGKTFAFVKERERWGLHAKSVHYLAFMADDQHMVNGEQDDYFGHQSRAAFNGAGLTLMEGNRHFDVLDERSDLSTYKVLWLPENITLNPLLCERIQTFVFEGGSLLVTGNGLWQREEWRLLLEELADVQYEGLGDETGDFIEPLPAVSHRQPVIPIKVKGSFVRLKLGNRANVLAKAIRPYEEINLRYGHFHAPPGKEADYPGAVEASYGKGRITIVSCALAADYYGNGSQHTRKLILQMIDRMSKPEERPVELHVQTPHIEISLMSKEGQWILHLLHFAARHNTGAPVMEDVPMRYNIPITLCPPHKPKRVYLAPSETDVPWEWINGKVEVTVPELHIHQMLVLEF